MSCYAGHDWGSGVPIWGKQRPKWAKYSLKIGEIELIYARSAFKMFSKHKSMPGALHERSLPRGSLARLCNHLSLNELCHLRHLRHAHEDVQSDHSPPR